MKKVIVTLIVLLSGEIFADHEEEIRVISPEVREGWNMLGFSLYPRVLSDSVVSSGWDTIMIAALENRMFYFDKNAGYSVADTFRIGEGFWMKATTNDFLFQEGIPFEERVHILDDGWNMISPLEKEIHPTALLYSHQMINSIWRWDAFDYKYRDVIADKSFMVPGVGYWIKSIGEDTLYYDSFSADVPPTPPASAKLLVQESQEQPPDPPVTVLWKTWAGVKKEVK